MDGNYLSNVSVDKIEKWVYNSISELINTGITQDIHLDSYMNFSNFSKRDVILASLELFKIFANAFSESQNSGFGLYLSIELREKGDKLGRAPKTFEQLCLDFEENSVPEIILYKPLAPVLLPQTEIYRRPLFFSGFDIFEGLLFFYKENRYYDRNCTDLDFTRELIVMSSAGSTSPSEN